MDTLVEEAVCNALSVVLGRPIAVGDTVEHAQEEKWDSLKHIEIIFSIEDALDIRFDQEEVASLDSLAKLLESANRHYAA